MGDCHYRYGKLRALLNINIVYCGSNKPKDIIHLLKESLPGFRYREVLEVHDLIAIFDP